VKPHKKKKLRTLATDLDSSADYDSYVSRLDSLPKIPVKSTENGGGVIKQNESAPLSGRHDSSDDEAIVAKLSSTLLPSDGSKAKKLGKYSIYTFVFP